jgi:homoserine kinase type II
VIGGALGRLHRVTADYRGPLRQASSTWRDGDPASATARCEALLESLQTTPGSLAERRREQLSKRLNDLLIWPRRLRRGLAPALSQQALHGDATRPNLLLDGDTVTLVDFRAVSGPVVWELAKIAFDPLTVAHSDTWPDVAAAVIGAYRQENPGVRPAELTATARVALLYRMFSTFGAVSHDPLAPPEAASLLANYWDDKHETIARLQQHLAEVEELLNEQAATSKAATR